MSDRDGQAQFVVGPTEYHYAIDMITEIVRHLETARLKVVTPFGPFKGGQSRFVLLTPA